jgi:hypothetical protein
VNGRAGIISAKNLLAGDVLLYRGTALVSRLIVLFDRPVPGTDLCYSHAALWDGDRAVEALWEGVRASPLDDSIRSTEYVDVYRFRDGKGVGLSGSEADGPWPLAPLRAQMKYYVDRADRYGYEQIMLLAFLAATRTASARLPLLVRQTMRQVLDEGAARISDLVRQKRQPLICSELVYRCFQGATPPYPVAVRGVHVSKRTAKPRLITALESPDTELAQAARAFMRGLTAHDSAAATFSMRRASKSDRLVVPDFVTPNDLANSPSLVRVGRLQGT